MGERWVRDCVVDLEHIDACWPRCHNRRPRRHGQRRRRLQHLQVSTRIVQLGYGGNSGDVGGGEVDENVDRAQAEITGSRSRSLCRVLGSVSLRFGLFTVMSAMGIPGVDPPGVRCARRAVVQQAPTAVHRGAARVRPERWSSPASKIDRSGPVIQHPVRSSRLAETANPDHARRSTDVGHRRSGRCSTACRHRSNEMTCRSRADGAEVVVEGAVRARADQRVSGRGSGRRGACPGGTVRHEWL